MQPPYELVYGYQHCMGRTQYSAGYVGTIAEALAWSREAAASHSAAVKPPAEDPLRWCPVTHCHMKRQRPWFGYRTADGSLTIESETA